MSLLGADVHNALEQLLSALASPDNELRTRAEEQLNTEWVATRPEVLLMGLVEQMQASTDPSVSFNNLSCLCGCVTDDKTLDRQGHLQLYFSERFQQRQGSCQMSANLASCFSRYSSQKRMQ